MLDAISKKSIFPDAPATAPWVTHAWRITRPGSDLTWVNPRAIRHADRLVGGQAHFYMETQACLAIPEDHDSVMNAPATPQEVSPACEVNPDQLKTS